MTETGKIAWTITGVAAVCLTMGGVSAAEPSQKVASGMYPTKELLLLMDQDRNGKVSKAEFMKFMEAEFEALDTNHDDELDVAELTGVQVRRPLPQGSHK